MKRLAFSVLTLFCAMGVFAQIQVYQPMNRLVFQRNNANQGIVPLQGSVPVGIDKIEAKATPIMGGNYADWVSITVNQGVFNGGITLSGGWYKIDIRAWQGSNLMYSTSVAKVGVGEVFVVSGHSVAQGGDAQYQIGAATDDRVNTVLMPLENTPGAQYFQTGNINDLPSFGSAVQFGANVAPAPFGYNPYFWSKFGELVVQNQQVPVMVFNAAFGGTNLEMWYKAANGIAFEHPFIKSSLGMPYRNLYNALQKYLSVTGVRAVLCDHGQNDTDLTKYSKAQLIDYYKGFIAKTRADFNPSLPFVINRHTPSINISPAYHIREVQEAVISTVANCFPGPDYDVALTDADRIDYIHLNASGQSKAAVAWARATINDFAVMNPFLPNYTASNSGTVSSCNFSDGQFLFDFYGEQIYAKYCNNVLYGVSAAGNFKDKTWFERTGKMALAQCACFSLTDPRLTGGCSAVIPTTPTNPVTPTTPTNPVQPTATGNSDLAVKMDASNAVPAVGDVIKIAVLIANNAGVTATNAEANLTLPTGLSFVGATIGNPTFENSKVVFRASNINVGAYSLFQFACKVNASGAYNLQTNIVKLDQTDNNTADNTATFSIKTPDAVNNATVTPNPVTPTNPTPVTPTPTATGNSDLALKMDATNAVPAVGDVIKIAVLIANNAGVTATNAEANLTLPTGLSFVGATIGNPTFENSKVVFRASNINVGAYSLFQFACKVNASGAYNLQTTVVKLDQTDNNTADNTATFSIKTPNTARMATSDEVTQSFELYPNPAITQATIKVFEPSSVQLFDMTGRVILSISMTDAREINVADLKTGLYIVQVINEKGEAQAKKLVINK
jgi:uncharacterized repeat protein (TIGR01451 family)